MDKFVSYNLHTTRDKVALLTEGKEPTSWIVYFGRERSVEEYREMALVVAQALSHPENRILHLQFDGLSLCLEDARVIADALKHPNCKVVHLDIKYSREEVKCCLLEVLQHENNKVITLLVDTRPVMDALANTLQHANNKVRDLYVWSEPSDEEFSILLSALQHPNNKVEKVRLALRGMSPGRVALLTRTLYHEHCKLALRWGKTEETLHHAIQVRSNRRVLFFLCSATRRGGAPIGKLPGELVRYFANFL